MWSQAAPRRSSRPGSPSATRTGADGSRWWPRDGFTGFKNAAGEEIPAARAVMDPYARRLPGRSQARRVPPPHPARDHRPSGPGGRPAPPGQTHPTHRRRPAHRPPGRAPLGPVRQPAPRSGSGRLGRPPAPGSQAYRTDDPGLGKHLTQQLIDSLKQAVPDGLEEIQTLARTLTERATDTPDLLRPPPHLQRPHAKPSTDASSTCAASPWASATSRTTPPAASSTPDASKTT